MPRKKQVKEITDPAFSGGSSFTVNKCKILTVNSIEEAASKLIEGELQEVVAVTGIYFSQDNKNVTNANISLAGVLYPDEKIINSNKLWAFNESLSLKFFPLECGSFKFSGQLTSELLDHNAVNYSLIKKKGEPVDMEALQEDGFNGFCLRAHIVPITSTTANLWIVIYPGSVGELTTEFAGAANPRWPGILLSKTEIQLGPVYSTIFDEACGTPILPGIIVGSPLNSIPAVPTTKEIVGRQASMMRTATIPETKSSRATMMDRWEQIQEEGDRQFKKSPVDPIWPELNTGQLDTDENNVEDDGTNRSGIEGDNLTDDEESIDDLIGEVEDGFVSSDEEDDGLDGSTASSVNQSSERKGERKKKDMEAKVNKPKRKLKLGKIESEKKRRLDTSLRAEESADSKSDEEDLGSNWELLRDTWPIEDRPVALRDKDTVNKKSMDTLLACFKMKMEKDKIDGNNDITKDGRQHTIIFKEEADNGTDKLHKARWCRMPTSCPSTWYKDVPLKRTPIIRNLPLEYSGSMNMVAQKSIEVIHNRANAFQLKHFFVGNINVQNKSRKDFFNWEDGKLAKEQDLSWETPQSLQQIQEALINWAIINQQLYPFDCSPWILQRLLVRYRWIQSAPDYIGRRNIISTLFEVMARTNASRAVNRGTPLSYKELEDMLKDILLKNGVSPEVPLPSIPKAGGSDFTSGSGQANRGGSGFGASGRGGGRGGFAGRGRGGGGSGTSRTQAMFDNNPVCYGYNTLDGRPCNKVKQGNGCKDGDKWFAHVCNKYVVGKGYCLQRHPKAEHRN